MSKRIIATPLWFLTGWMFGAWAALILGLPTWTAPMVAIAFAAVVWFDPAGWFWVRDADTESRDRPGTHRPAVLSSVSPSKD